MSGFQSLPPPPPQPSAPSRSSTALIIGAILAMLIITLGIAGLAVGLGFRFLSDRVNHGSSATPSAPADITSSSGLVVFSDDFHDVSSGWGTFTLASGTSFSYRDGNYVVIAKGSLHHFSNSPYTELHQQLSASVTATQSVNAPAGAGFGVTFTRGAGSQQVRYEFLVLAPGSFFIETASGPTSPTLLPTVIKTGSAPASPGVTPLTVAAACATSPDDKTTRLLMFVNGVEVASVVDSQNLAGTGWQAGLAVASRVTNTSTVTITHFDEHDLEG